MFAKSDGPTALRADLVRALAFSEAKVAQPGDEILVESVAALAAVWNGRKGYVAILVRRESPPSLDRYVSESAITSAEALAVATEEAVAFAESLGFAMDAPAFGELTEVERDARMQRWNTLRKLRKPAEPRVTEAMSSGDTAEFAVPDPPAPPAVTPAESAPPLAMELEELSVPAPPPIPDIEVSEADVVPSVDPEAETSLVSHPHASSTVLGRISLVRRGGADARRLEQLARLLAFF